MKQKINVTVSKNGSLPKNLVKFRPLICPLNRILEHLKIFKKIISKIKIIISNLCYALLPRFFRDALLKTEVQIF